MFDPVAFWESGFAICHNAIDKDSLLGIVDVLRSGLRRSDARDDMVSIQALIADREKEEHAIVYNAQVQVGSSFPAYNLLSKSTIFDIASKVTD